MLQFSNMGDACSIILTVSAAAEKRARIQIGPMHSIGATCESRRT